MKARSEMQLALSERRAVISDPDFNIRLETLSIGCVLLVPFFILAVVGGAKVWTVNTVLILLVLWALPWLYVYRRLYRIRLDLDATTGLATLTKSRLIGFSSTETFGFDEIDRFAVEAAPASIKLYVRDDFPVMVLKNGRRISISGRSFPFRDARLTETMVQANRFIGREGAVVRVSLPRSPLAR